MRRASLFCCLLLLGLGTACDEGDTIIVENTDCGLIRTDLLGVWDLTYPPAGGTLFNCSDPSFNGADYLPLAPATVSFADMAVFASASNAGFFFQDSAGPSLLLGNAEADTCGMLFSVRTIISLADPQPIQLQCIGNFDRAARVVQGHCDSVTVLDTPLTDPPGVLADCDIDPIPIATILIH